MAEFDCLVIGAGQAGLAAAWHLTRAGLRFRVLEATTDAGGSWPLYYDSLRLFSPVAYSSLPGWPMRGHPQSYPRRDEVVQYLQTYAKHFDIPVLTNRTVRAIERRDSGFEVRTTDGSRLTSATVIVATGGFSKPHVPALPGMSAFKGRILHSRDYRSPRGFDGQRVIVVGGANSGVQIATELAHVARVTIATRQPIRFVPQRILGRDFHFWIAVTGLERTRWLNDRDTPVLDDGRYRRAIRAGRPDRRPMFECLEPNGVKWSDGQMEVVDTLLLATGFDPNVDFLASLHPVDEKGRLRQRNGVAEVPGLYYVGFPRQRNFASATLRGVGPDAGHVVHHLQRYLDERAQCLRRRHDRSAIGRL